MNKNLPDLIEDFLRYLKVQRGRTTLTVRNYRLYLKRFLNWSLLASLGQAADLTREKLRDYRLWLTRQKSLGGIPLSSATQNYHLTALRSFVNYLRHKNVPTLAATNIVLNPPQKRKVIILTTADKQFLLQAVKESHEPTLVKIRDEIIINLISASGLKISELVILEKNQLQEGASMLGIKSRPHNFNLALSSEMKQLMNSYLNLRTDQSEFLFVRHDRAADSKPTRLTPRSVQRSLERYRKLAGLKQKITPHTLRHLFAYRLASQGADVATLQKNLGLKHPAAAYVYKKSEKLNIDQKSKIT